MKKQSSQREILLDGERISYQLEYKQVKNINMRIRPETGLSISAPFSVSIAEIEAILQQNRSKILQTLHDYAEKEQEKQQQYPVQYIDGETILYLGKYVTLQVALGQKEGVYPETGKLLLVTRHPESFERRRNVFDTWWNAACKKAVNNLCRAVYPIFQPHNVAYPTIRFRAMVSQWGNCRPERGLLTFNTRLLAAPVRCMEYVVIHEFTHLIHPNHSAQFYAFIAAELPDWKQLQQQLQDTVETRIAPERA